MTILEMSRKAGQASMLGSSSSSLPPPNLPAADGSEGMDALNTTAVLACLKGRPGFATLSVCSAALVVIWLQIFTLLNLSWLLNNARMADMLDYDENYVLIPHKDLKNDTVKVLETDHKHLGGQSDRFCYDTTSGHDRVNFYYTYYYNCIYTNTMTYWDLVTIFLLTLALADKVGEAHQELTLEMVLASAALQEPGVSILRRAVTLGFLGWRCLLEALFLVVSIVIVAASKGTVEMVLNSLAISFFADLDNVAWKRLISTIPSVKAMQKELIHSVAKTHAAALGAIEERKLQTVLFTASSLIIYIVGTISYKNPKLFKWLGDRSPDDDSNIGVALLLIPSIAVWTTMAVHFGSISNHAIKLQAKMGSEVPGSSTIVVGHAVTISLCLLFLTIGIQEAGAGAQCAWRLNMINALILAVPLMAMHALVQLRLRQPRDKAVRAALSAASAVLATLSISLAFRNSFSETLDPLTNAVMSGTSTCGCGYGGWWANPEDFCKEQCHLLIDGICDPAVKNPDFAMPRALWCPNLAEDPDDPHVCPDEIGTEGGAVGGTGDDY